MHQVGHERLMREEGWCAKEVPLACQEAFHMFSCSGALRGPAKHLKAPTDCPFGIPERDPLKEGDTSPSRF